MTHSPPPPPLMSVPTVLLLVLRSASPLAQLYSTSTMEHHHFDQCIMILNSPVGPPYAKQESKPWKRRYTTWLPALTNTLRGVGNSLFSGRASFWGACVHRTHQRYVIIGSRDVTGVRRPRVGRQTAGLSMGLFSGRASFWGACAHRTQVDEKFAYENSEMRTNENKQSNKWHISKACFPPGSSNDSTKKRYSQTMCAFSSQDSRALRDRLHRV